MQVAECCRSGWSDKCQCHNQLLLYWKARNGITFAGNLLLYNQCLIVPKSLQAETFHKIYEGHQGIAKCQLRSKISVWWPGIGCQIKQMVEECHVFAQEAQQ